MSEEKQTAAEMPKEIRLAHKRAANFQYHACTGAVSVPISQDRIQMSFYSERAEVNYERLSQGEDGIRLAGDLNTSLIREHIVGLDMSVATARDIYLMLKGIFEK
ncbi:hypothetical protein [Veronia pacifica]|uniref:Uncharacterized protein n=1 Tax=Veronia pacifica TaxID=1080227 RepID=A0A1C3E7Z9_9GAMM|nr:hypothetical protein [Veronia pacifica]ODA29351.1 hypothetical protein A8L45_22330 [Veronia pacifica]